MNKQRRILFSSEEIRKRNEELGTEISNDYKDGELVIISLLRGSFIFASDLVRNITIPVEIDFMTTSSYENREESTGKVKIVTDIRSDIEGKDVLIVDDIIDSGFTMKYVIDHIQDKKPKSIKTCVLLDKPSRRRVEVYPDYAGFSIPDVFIVGYGLNYGEYYRNIPYIFTFDE
ncbi:hypoxanthine phosphoribosyltransferase [Sporanaerobacter acetigenes]|uniref:Hypoxanthine phosphoribosyltransferase n=1 Tax=Sporanaerobacter acetigenes DSM 13106 TaxID=1123281 RepID=A0A1M5WT34_9FIRM|nr:hypoxanthine phosphoribosyltransferase [Sporanaerobacter acetigenes]SHH90776.1 hypoxanthine phosphoribosyltransferase [Sporanaerobacter acetigenes DSM 13106]